MLFETNNRHHRELSDPDDLLNKKLELDNFF